MSLQVASCTRQAARYAVTHWHYSRTVPTAKVVHYGVWEDNRFIGAILFGDGASNTMLRGYHLDYTQGAELVRVALTEHHAPVSQIVSRALRLLQAHSPGLRLVLSYADPEHGHHGGIYQAGNWIYTGMTEPAEEYIVNGRRMHGRALRKTRESHVRGGIPTRNTLEWARLVLDPDARMIMGSIKHRYLYPLDRAMRRQLAPLARPYPRGRGVHGDTSGDLPEGAGSTPAVRSNLLGGDTHEQAWSTPGPDELADAVRLPEQPASHRHG